MNHLRTLVSLRLIPPPYACSTMSLFATTSEYPQSGRSILSIYLAVDQRNVVIGDLGHHSRITILENLPFFM